jgi:hypothetical protein
MMTKHKLLFSVLLGIAGNAFLIFLAYVFIFSAVQESYTSLLASHEERALLEKKTRLLRETEATIKTYQSDIDRINSAFLRSSEVVAFVERLETIAIISGVNLTINSAFTMLDDSTTERSVFNLSLEGTFPAIHQYITLLENVPFHARIQNATMNQGTEGEILQGILIIDVLTLK